MSDRCTGCGEKLPAGARFCPKCGKKKGVGNPKYKTPEDLAKACDAYFAKCDEEGTLYSEAGLCLALDVLRVTLRLWYDGTARPEFKDVVQRAYLRIEEQIATSPAYMEKGMVTKAIFLQKQPQFGGYQDRIEAKQDIAVNVKMGKNVDETDFK